MPALNSTNNKINSKIGFQHGQVTEGSRIGNINFFKQESQNTQSLLGSFYNITVQTDINSQQNNQNSRVNLNSNSFNQHNNTQNNKANSNDSFQQKVENNTTKSFSNKIKNEKFSPALQAISSIIQKSNGEINNNILNEVAYHISTLGLSDNDFKNGNTPSNVTVEDISTVIYDKNQASVVAQIINKTFEKIKQGEISIQQAQQQFAAKYSNSASR